MFVLQDGPLDYGALRAAVLHPGAGCVLLFEGVTRDTFEERRVLRLEYEAYGPMAEAELAAIGAEVQAELPGVRVAMAHRVGLVPVSEPSVLIAVSAPHRVEGYEASRRCIERLKARVPIWKREVYADGASWTENSPSSRGPDGR